MDNVIGAIVDSQVFFALVGLTAVYLVIDAIVWLAKRPHNMPGNMTRERRR